MASTSAFDEGDEIREAVRTRYADAALRIVGAGADDCCGSDGGDASCGGAYSSEELAQAGVSGAASLGCGNPTALAELRPGERVLDLGSGAGLDVLLSAKRVGPGGHAYGVDMTDEMLAAARANQARAGIENATFLKGTIEAIPLPDASVDVVISNCVINLAANKRAVLGEAFRVLRPGGRLAVADMVARGELSAEARRRLDLWAGCISGTIPQDEYATALADAGFDRISFETVGVQVLDGVGTIESAHIRAHRPGGGA